MRIAIDIDSTLHPYWEQLAAAARRHFGVDLPYETQFTWGIDRLRPEQLAVCIAETHAPEQIVAAEPYSGAVEVVSGWHEQGHFIHVTSHRVDAARDATARWLEQIGLLHDELHCSFDKIARCREIGIDVLIDDSPLNLAAAIDAGITAATIAHPWNRELCETEDVICAADWPGLKAALAPLVTRAP